MTQNLADNFKTSISGWLKDIECERFVDLFVKHEVSIDALPHLTESDLREIGIPLGPRKIILAAISQIEHDEIENSSGQQRALRRQLTVLFCDIAGSTDMLSTLDPEDVSEVLSLFRAAATEEITRYGGYIARYMGDGVLAYFGYPNAQEDDAERAVRAGLSINRRVGEMKSHAIVKTRTGIATGLVVIGDLLLTGASQERDVIGKTLHLAARLQAIAEPSTVVIAQTTQSLTRGLFGYTNQREVRLKGFDDPVRVYEVLGESGVESRFEALRSNKTPLIGRARELAVLEQCWQATKEGRGQILSISGEAGIGKSRLVSEFVASIAKEHHIRLKFFGSPEHASSPLHPVIVQLKNAARFSGEDSPDILRNKLAALVPLGDDQNERIDTLSDLLSIPSDTVRLEPQVRKQRTFFALITQIEELARQAPVVAIFEDAHWIDASSLELLALLLETLNAHPVLLIVTSRPEFKPPWQTVVPSADQKDVLLLANHLNLGRLDHKANFTLVKTFAEGAKLSTAVLEQIAFRTDGIPLFVEEVTRAVVESSLIQPQGQNRSGGTGTSLADIPVTLQDSLTARLDQLGTAVETAQIGSVIGRQFNQAILAAVDGGDFTLLQTKLEQLQKSQLIDAVQKDGQVSYRFRHALVQDAAYSSLLRGRRSEIHGKVAKALEEHNVGNSDIEPEVLAYHWARAGRPRRAIDRFFIAVKAALSRSAAAEASSLLDEAFRLISQVSDQTEQIRCEAEFHLLKVQVITLTQAVSSPDVEPALERAQSLAFQSDDYRLLTSALVQRWSHLLFIGEPRKAKLIAENLFNVASRQKGTEHTETLLSAHLAMALIEQDLGQLNNSHRNFEHAQMLIDTADKNQITVLGLRPDIVIRSFHAWVLFQQGYPEKAQALSLSSIKLAEKMEHPLSICMSQAMDSVLLFANRDADALKRCGDKFQKIAIQHNIPFYESIAKMSLGGAMILKDLDKGGLALVRDGLKFAREAGYRYQSGVLSCTYLESLLCLGETDAGLKVVNESLANADNTGEREFLPEQLRLKGEFLVQSDRLSEAKDAMLAAISAAKEQNAKMWELRAALSLSRVYLNEGNKDSAQALVSPIYEWFTEGFLLDDLQEARALLSS